MRGFNDKLFGNKLYAGQLPTQLGLIGSQQVGLLLDTYPNSAAAYSLRKLRAAYTGSAIRVRRTDLTESDIGFTSAGNLDTTALLGFTGTGALDNGFITTWYDQSGNGRDATQTTAINQPQIVNSGSLILQNFKPAVQFDGINDNFLLSSNIPTTNSTYSIFDVSLPTDAVSSDTILGGNAGSIQVRYDVSRFEILRTQQLLILSDNSRAINNQYLNSSFTKNTGNSIYANNVLKVTNTINPLFTQPILRMGASLTGVELMKGTIQEVVIYTSDQILNVNNINTNINSFYSIY
jgi:hypothetical protein